jgi:ADP-ribose pyrophosphatase YjhB (NUDIX family)
MEKIVIVVRAVFCFRDKYLVIEQENDSENKYLLFPGGHVEPNESLKEALFREVNEELFIKDIQIIRLAFIKETLSPFDRNYELFFECSTSNVFEDIYIKQSDAIGHEKIKRCMLKTSKELKEARNFFPEEFFKDTKYQYLELDLPKYMMRFGKDRNIATQEK